MLTLFGLLVISIWFYQSAKAAKKNALLWVGIGWLLFITLGLLLKVISEKYILQLDTLEGVFSMSLSIIALQLISIIVILIFAYLISEMFLKERRY